MKSLDEWLHYIEKETIDCSAHFSVTQTIANQLRLTSFSCPVITIAGTNGKGSVAHLLEAILSHSGFRVGCYTSPHLLYYNERIRINNKPVTDKTLCNAFQLLNPIRIKAKLNYFTFTTLVALYLFQQEALDFIILEVGLGGQYDPVNVVSSDIAVITSIDLDHCHILGNSREDIAKEKSGIFRNGKPIVCGETTPPFTLEEKAKNLNAPFYLLGRDFHYDIKDHYWDWWSEKWNLTAIKKSDLYIENVAIVLKIIEFIKENFNIDELILKNVIAEFCLIGRRWIHYQTVKHLFDVAHNPGATQLLANYIESMDHLGNIHAVFSIQSEKDILNSLRPMIPHINAWYVAPLSNSKGANNEQIFSSLKRLRAKQIHLSTSIQTAYQKARDVMKENDLLLIFGSFHTVKEVLIFLNMG